MLLILFRSVLHLPWPPLESWGRGGNIFNPSRSLLGWTSRYNFRFTLSGVGVKEDFKQLGLLKIERQSFHVRVPWFYLIAELSKVQNSPCLKWHAFQGLLIDTKCMFIQGTLALETVFNVVIIMDSDQTVCYKFGLFQQLYVYQD